MADKPYYYDRQTILSLCPAPPGTRIAYADEEEDGGVWYEPCYFVAVCDCQTWMQHVPIDRRPDEPHGKPTREIHPVSYVDGYLDVCTASNLLALLMPGQELDEADQAVIAARKAARVLADKT